MKEARAGRDTPSLFKIGDNFVPGAMEITPEGVNVSFCADEIARLNIDIIAIRGIGDIGIARTHHAQLNLLHSFFFITSFFIILPP